MPFKRLGRPRHFAFSLHHYRYRRATKSSHDISSNTQHHTTAASPTHLDLLQLEVEELAWVEGSLSGRRGSRARRTRCSSLDLVGGLLDLVLCLV